MSRGFGRRADLARGHRLRVTALACLGVAVACGPPAVVAPTGTLSNVACDGGLDADAELEGDVDGGLPEARALARAGIAARANGDAAGAARSLSAARSIYRRRAGAEPEASFLSHVSVGGWAGEVPSWSILALGLPVEDDRRTSGYAVGIVDEEAGAVALTRILDGSGPPWPVWPGRPGWFAASTPSGVAIVAATAKDSGSSAVPRRLDAHGTPIWSPAGDLLLVAGDTNLAGYETATWTKTLDLKVKAYGDGMWLRDGAVYAEVGEHGALFVDLRARRVIFDEGGPVALSGSQRLLAGLSDEGDAQGRTVYFVDLRSIDALDKPRRVRLPLGVSFRNSPTLHFVGDRRLIVGEEFRVAGPDHEDVEYAVIDVASGAVRSSNWKVSGSARYWKLEQEAYKTLTRAVRKAVSAPRVLARGERGAKTFDVSPSGRIVAGTAGIAGKQCGGSTHYLSDVSILIGDARKASLVREVKIPVASFCMSRVDLAPDDATVIACGDDGADPSTPSGRDLRRGFVVDSASGRVSELPLKACEYEFDAKGTRLLLAAGVVDLERLPGRPWPRLFRVELAPAGATAGTKAQPDETQGLVCRFGELLAPFAVCPEPGPPRAALPRDGVPSR